MTYEGSGTGRELKKPIPEIREREGNKKIHSQISGMGREWKNPIPKIREREGNEKNHSQNSGTGIKSYYSIPGNNSFSFPFPKWIFLFPSCSRILGMDFFIPFPFPNFGNGLFQFPSRSRTLGMEFSIPVPVPEPSKVIPAHPWPVAMFCYWVSVTDTNFKGTSLQIVSSCYHTPQVQHKDLTKSDAHRTHTISSIICCCPWTTLPLSNIALFQSCEEVHTEDGLHHSALHRNQCPRLHWVLTRCIGNIPSNNVLFKYFFPNTNTPSRYIEFGWFVLRPFPL